MTIYSEQVNALTGEFDQYVCWSTPEARSLIDEMLAERQKDGELDLVDPNLRNEPFNIEIWREKRPSSPVFRQAYGSEPARYKMGKAEKEETEKRRTDKLYYPENEILTSGDMKAYLRKKRSDYLEPMPKRIKLFNGFRSYVQTILAHNINPPLTETEVDFFLGRELPKMGKHYDVWGKLEALKKFLKAVRWLTINKKKYYLETIAEKDQKINEMELEKKKESIRLGINDQDRGSNE